MKLRYLKKVMIPILTNTSMKCYTYLKNVDADVIVFEDMDRFNANKIF